MKSLDEAAVQLDELSEAVRDETRSSVSFELDPVHSVIDELETRVIAGDCVGVIVIDGSNLSAWERNFGSATFGLLMSRLSIGIENLRGQVFRHDDLVCIDDIGGDSIVVFLAPSRDATLAVDFESLQARIQHGLFGVPLEPTYWFKEAAEKIAVGSAMIIHNQSVDARREIYRAIRTARAEAQSNLKETQRKRHRIIGRMIAQSTIQTFYQPICSINDGGVLGFEALSRPGSDEAEQLGIHLFIAAAHAQLDGELDHACRTLSVTRRPTLDKDVHLFINCLPDTFVEPERGLNRLLAEWEADGLKPTQLVFEITENITHEQLKRISPNVLDLRKRGYKFAIDDVGTGTTNLQLIADLDPDYLKMDISLTRGVATSERKQALTAFLLELAERTDSIFIAEGIESEEDRDTLREIGVEWGQGFLFGRPTMH